MRKPREAGGRNLIEQERKKSFWKWALKRHNTFAILLAFIISSCQTTSYIGVKLPLTNEQVFEYCSPGDGGVFVEVEMGPESNFSTEVDWVAKGTGLKMEAYSPFGQTIASFSSDHSKGTLEVMAPLKETSSLSTDKSGRVLYSDYYTGINLTEIPCFLKGKVPRQWLDKVVRYENTSTMFDLEIRDSGRDIKILLEKAKTNQFCAIVSWRHFLGLISNEYEFCHLASQGRSMISFEKGVRLKWKKLESI